MKFLKSINKNIINLYFLCFLFSFHLFFWDVTIFGNYGLREPISILSIYILYEFIKENFKLLKINFKKISVLFLFGILITIHLFWNNSIDGKNLHLHSYQGLAGLLFLLLLIYFYYDFITKNIQNFIYIFIILFIFSLLFSTYSYSTLYEQKVLCASFIKVTNKLIFKENSHLGMVFFSCIAYLIVKYKEKSFKFHFFVVSFAFLIIWLRGSATGYLSIFIALALILILNFKFFIKKILAPIIFFGLIVFVFSSNLFFPLKLKYRCIDKVSSSSLEVLNYLSNINLINEKLNIDNTKTKNIDHSKETLSDTIDHSKETLSDTIDHSKETLSYTVHKQGGNEKVDKNISYPDLPRVYPNLIVQPSLSLSVLLNSFNISLETLKTRPLGWGLNRYEYAFDYYMFENIIKPYFYHEVYTLNYNDGSSNISKLITEFGIFAFLIIPFVILFVFTKNINLEKKIFFLVLFCTQLARGAGYFNGGFIFSLIYMIFTVLKFYRKQND